MAALAIEVGKMLPEGTWMDGHYFDYGRRFGISVVRPDGSRHATIFDVERAPSAKSLMAKFL